MTNPVDGFLKFRKDIYPAKRNLYRQLAGGQNPHTLFITCADSRIVPNTILQAEAGDLFLCRTVGNQVPPHGTYSGDGVASSIEYALEALGVQHVVICGHSDCGAMKAVLRPDTLQSLPATAAWLRHAEVARQTVLAGYQDQSDEVLLHLLTEENIVAQLQHLKTHPAVAARLARGDLQLHGWLYHIHSGEITAYDMNLGRFNPLGRDAANATPPRRNPLAKGEAA
jgi:carbonic anhydrase